MNKAAEGKVNSYRFDRVFPAEATNLAVYQAQFQDMVLRALQGYNMTVFAFGQTNSGKTFTMFGDDQTDGMIMLVAK